MIDNSDQVGSYFVLIRAEHNVVRQFQCPTLNDAFIEAGRICDARRLEGLAVSSATAREILSKTRKGLVLSGDTFDLLTGSQNVSETAKA